MLLPCCSGPLPPSFAVRLWSSCSSPDTAGRSVLRASCLLHSLQNTVPTAAVPHRPHPGHLATELQRVKAKQSHASCISCWSSTCDVLQAVNWLVWHWTCMFSVVFEVIVFNFCLTLAVEISPEKRTLRVPPSLKGIHLNPNDSSVLVVWTSGTANYFTQLAIKSCELDVLMLPACASWDRMHVCVMANMM